MGYDKEHIAQAKKMGVFDDNSLDPAVLGLEDEEKARLSRELRESRDAAGPSRIRTVEPASEGDAGDVDEGMTFLERLSYFLQRLFLGVSIEEFKRKKALKRVLISLRKYRPPVYQPHSGRVTGYFGTLLYKLAAQSAGFKKVMTHCRSNRTADAEGGMSFPEHILSLFVEEMPDLERKFGYSYVKNNAGLFVEKRIRETVEKEIDAGLKAIPHERRSQVNALYANLVAFERLAEFNFYSLLRKFGQSFSRFEDSFPDFSPADGGSVLADLRKIEDLLFALDFSLDMSPVFSAVARFYSSIREGAVGAELPEWGDSDITGLQEGINALLAGERLTNLVRIISRDPAHYPRVRLHQVSLIEEVRQSILARQLPRCQNLVHQVEMDTLNLRIKDLFGSEPLSAIEFYNEQTNRKLAEYGLPLFTNSRYLQIIKTYYERLFSVLIKPALNIVVVDGNFFDKMLQGRLGDYFYKFEEISEALLEFEKKVTPATKEGEKLGALFYNYSGDPPTKKVLTEKIHYLNNLSAKLIRDAAERLANAQPALQAIVKDAFGSNKPEFLLNVKQIGGSRNRAIIKAIQKAADATALVFSILKPFL